MTFGCRLQPGRPDVWLRALWCAWCDSPVDGTGLAVWNFESGKRREAVIVCSPTCAVEIVKDDPRRTWHNMPLDYVCGLAERLGVVPDLQAELGERIVLILNRRGTWMSRSDIHDRLSAPQRRAVLGTVLRQLVRSGQVDERCDRSNRTHHLAYFYKAASVQAEWKPRALQPPATTAVRCLSVRTA
jgi:hypothetical protein